MGHLTRALGGREVYIQSEEIERLVVIVAKDQITYVNRWRPQNERSAESVKGSAEGDVEKE
jgi:pantothenate kinase-related protein Tda10